jgi:hypothetical protein
MAQQLRLKTAAHDLEPLKYTDTAVAWQPKHLDCCLLAPLQVWNAGGRSEIASVQRVGG